MPVVTPTTTASCAVCGRTLYILSSIRMDAVIHGEQRAVSVGGYYCCVSCAQQALTQGGKRAGRDASTVLPNPAASA